MRSSRHRTSGPALCGRARRARAGSAPRPRCRQTRRPARRTAPAHGTAPSGSRGAASSAASSPASIRLVPRMNEPISSGFRTSPARSRSIVTSSTCCARSSAAESSRRCFSPYSRTRRANRRYNSDSSACASPGGAEAMALATSPSLAVESPVSALPRTSATLTAAPAAVKSRVVSRERCRRPSSALGGRWPEVAPGRRPVHPVDVPPGIDRDEHQRVVRAPCLVGHAGGNVVEPARAELVRAGRRARTPSCP